MTAADEVEGAYSASQAGGLPVDDSIARHPSRAFLQRLFRSRSGRFGLFLVLVLVLLRSSLRWWSHFRPWR